ncbi:MAG: hypothetical protein KC468_34455 [Myxococcales bacterium]|nr:hypothetical protein [Myxococcales bacterium]
MTTDGGGYAYLKVMGADSKAPAAEMYCEQYGMHLFIPRSPAHKDVSYAIATDANIGPDGNQTYMRILGVYPKFNGATCSQQGMNSDNNNCGWQARDAVDGGTFWVHNVNNITEPNGDNNVIQSMYYNWNVDASIQWHNDVTAGYSSTRWMCDFADKYAP